MKIKKYIMALIVVATLLLAPAIASAGYSDEITDPEGDVSHREWYETGWRWRENVERPDIDIVRASIEEIGGEIHVELEVKGTVRSQEDTDSYLWYQISLEDEEGESYEFNYYFGELYMIWPGGQQYGVIEASGFGTSTLELSFSLEDVGSPNSLQITSVETYEYLDEAGSGELYQDTAGPEADEPVNGNDNDNGDFDFDFDEGFIDDLIARGMLCIALAIILPIIIIIVIIVIIVKVLKSDDKGGEQPPQQQYQQPPPPSGPSENQEQTQAGQGGTPPPPEDMNEKI